MKTIPDKPLGYKNYGSIGHLPGSKMGTGDHCVNEGQASIATVKAKTKSAKYEIIVQEKLDGSNVGVARIDGGIYPLGRKGYLAASSSYYQHRCFAEWVNENKGRFLSVLNDGERLAGEWLMEAHGTKYKLRHEPFVAFDLMKKHSRLPYDEFCSRVDWHFAQPHLLHRGEAFSIAQAVDKLNVYGFHGATDPVEGAIWRVERDKPTREGKKRIVCYLAKYVRPDKVDGCYLPSQTGKDSIWNWEPSKGKR